MPDTSTLCIPASKTAADGDRRCWYLVYQLEERAGWQRAGKPHTPTQKRLSVTKAQEQPNLYFKCINCIVELVAKNKHIITLQRFYRVALES